MTHYVYKITNKLNGKWYMGKRKHHSPIEDNYMGSGKLIKEAIKKYGIEKFEKTIIEIFDTNEEAAKLEAFLVTKESISSNMSYNMHEGGHGGFAHLNNGSKEHIDRCKLGAKNSSGRDHPNWGNRAWTKDDQRAKNASIKGNSFRKEHGLSEEHKNKIKEAALKREELRRTTGYYQRNVD